MVFAKNKVKELHCFLVGEPVAARLSEDAKYVRRARGSAFFMRRYGLPVDSLGHLDENAHILAVARFSEAG